jgi:WD40 repeat protein
MFQLVGKIPCGRPDWSMLGNTVQGISFSPDGTRILVQYWPKTAIVYDAQSFQVLFEIIPEQRCLQSTGVARSMVRGASFTPDGSRIILPGDFVDTNNFDAGSVIFVHSASDGSLERRIELKDHLRPTRRIEFVSGTTLMVVCSPTDIILVFDYETGKMVRQFGEKGGYGVLSRTGKTMLLHPMATKSKSPELLNLSTLKPSVVFPVAERGKGTIPLISAMAYLPDPGDDKKAPRGVMFSGNKRLVTCDLKGSLLQTITTPYVDVGSITFFPLVSKAHLVLIARNYTQPTSNPVIDIWDWRKGVKLDEIPHPHEGTSTYVMLPVWAPETSTVCRLATAIHDTVWLWELRE